MEEQKKTKEIKMNTEGNQQREPLTYEQLNDVCNQLWQQNQQLTKKCQELDNFNMFKRLDYLFKVLDYPTLFDKKFVSTCAKEIKEIMVIPQETEKKR